MAQIANLRFPKVFVLDPTTELITDDTKVPNDLTAYQVGIFNSKTGVGVDAAPANWLDCPVIEIHQNVGDNKHGTVRTRHINAQQVVRWHAQKAAAAVDQILYIGYDEVVGTKNLVAYKGQDIIIAISVFDNEIRKWFGNTGYTERIVFDAASCAPCVADCEALDPDDIADYFVAYINGTDAPTGNIPVTKEITNWVTASKVATGTQGASDRRVGIKLAVKAHTPNLLAACQVHKIHRPQLTTINASVGANCPNFPITTTVKAKAGCGWPTEVAELEAESQGYDRVREQFEDVLLMKSNFIIRATDGVKYDFYYLEYNLSHKDSGQPKSITDPYMVIFPVPTGTGQKLEDFFNAWLGDLGHDDVTIAAGAGKGSAIDTVNA